MRTVGGYVDIAAKWELINRPQASLNSSIPECVCKNCGRVHGRRSPMGLRVVGRYVDVSANEIFGTTVGMLTPNFCGMGDMRLSPLI